MFQLNMLRGKAEWAADTKSSAGWRASSRTLYIVYPVKGNSALWVCKQTLHLASCWSHWQYLSTQGRGQGEEEDGERGR